MSLHKNNVRQQAVDQLINVPVISHRGRHRQGGSDDSAETLLERIVEQIVDVPVLRASMSKLYLLRPASNPTMTRCVPNLLFHVIPSQDDFLQDCVASFFLSHATRLSKVNACTESSRVSAHGASRLVRDRPWRSCSSTFLLELCCGKSSRRRGLQDLDYCGALWPPRPADQVVFVFVRRDQHSSGRAGRAPQSGTSAVRCLLGTAGHLSLMVFFATSFVAETVCRADPSVRRPAEQGRRSTSVSFSCLCLGGSLWLRSSRRRSRTVQVARLHLTEYQRLKPLGGTAVRRACHSVVRFSMDDGKKGCEVDDQWIMALRRPEGETQETFDYRQLAATQQHAHFIPSDTFISPNRDRDQGPCTLALKRETEICVRRID